MTRDGQLAYQEWKDEINKQIAEIDEQIRPLSRKIDELHKRRFNLRSGGGKVPIETLGLSVRTCNRVKRTGIETVEPLLDMLYKGEEAILSIKGIGKKGLDDIVDALRSHGYLV